MKRLLLAFAALLLAVSPVSAQQIIVPGGGGGSGTVTQVTCGTGLGGGVFTTSGTCSLTTPVAAANGGAGTITGALKANGAGVVSAAAAADLSNGVTGSGAVVLATSPTIATAIMTAPALGTPSSLVGTNITGTGAGFTAGTVTTNANLTGPITSSGNATTVAAQTGTGSTFVMSASPTLTTPTFTAPVLGTPASGVMTNVTGTAASLTAGNASQLLTGTWAVPGTIGSTTPNTGAFTTLSSTGLHTTVASATGGAGLRLPHGAAPTSPVNGDVWTTTAGMYAQINGGTVGPLGTGGGGGNLTGPITSVGLATSIASQTGTGTKFVMDTSPTLVTPALGTPASGVMTNVTGTASGLTAGNASQLLTGTWAAPGTIGSTTKNTGAFTTLAATGVVTLTGGTGSSTLDFSAGTAGTTGELYIKSGVASLNTLGLQCTLTTCFSALAVRDSGGREKMAIGYGGTATSYPFGDAVYWEGSNYPSTGTDTPPAMRIIQTGTLNGGAYGNYRRMEFYTDGNIYLFTSDGTTIAQAFVANGDTFLNFNLTAHGKVSTNSTVGPPAGGNNGNGIGIGSTANFGIFYGSGAPTLSAAQGSIYMRTDGSSTSTRMYINTNGSTGWTNVVTAT